MRCAKEEYRYSEKSQTSSYEFVWHQLRLFLSRSSRHLQALSACEAAVWKVPEWWMCSDIWELPTDGALLNSFSTKHGDSVINCSGTWPHVRELEYMGERINEQLINVLWLNNIQNWLATASLLFLLCEELRHSWVVLIYLKAAWPNPISLRKLHDIIMCPKVHFT